MAGHELPQHMPVNVHFTFQFGDTRVYPHGKRQRAREAALERLRREAESACIASNARLTFLGVAAGEAAGSAVAAGVLGALFAGSK